MDHWLEKYPLADPEHAHDLERAAAIHQHHGGLDKEQAEATSYQKYKVLQHQKAAAHHLNGMRNAKAAARPEDGHRHYIMYCSHVKELGLNPHHPVPPEIIAHITDEKSDNYQVHGADDFISTK